MEWIISEKNKTILLGIQFFLLTSFCLYSAQLYSEIFNHFQCQLPWIGSQPSLRDTTVLKYQIFFSSSIHQWTVMNRKSACEGTRAQRPAPMDFHVHSHTFCAITIELHNATSVAVMIGYIWGNTGGYLTIHSQSSLQMLDLMTCSFVAGE